MFDFRCQAPATVKVRTEIEDLTASLMADDEYSDDHIAAVLNVSVSTARRKVKAGQARRRAGGAVKVRLEAVREVAKRPIRPRAGGRKRLRANA